MGGFILFIVAYVLFIPLTIVNVCIVVLKTSWKNLSGYFYSSALNLDVYGCRELRTLWNTILIKKNGYQFGKSGYSISHDLGVNQLQGTLSKCGKVLVFILNLIEKDHCIKAVTSKQ